MNVPQKTWEIVVPDEQATREFARDLAFAIAPGDVIAIGGELGSRSPARLSVRWRAMKRWKSRARRSR
jgi:ABC-type phosphonate transport system ATPase subunit